jgi:hypothetical protein
MYHNRAHRQHIRSTYAVPTASLALRQLTKRLFQLGFAMEKKPGDQPTLNLSMCSNWFITLFASVYPFELVLTPPSPPSVLPQSCSAVLFLVQLYTLFCYCAVYCMKRDGRCMFDYAVGCVMYDAFCVHTNVDSVLHAVLAQLVKHQRRYMQPCFTPPALPSSLPLCLGPSVMGCFHE